MLVPRLDGGNFFGLTISSQFEILTQEAKGEPVTLVGSSMGGYLAALYAARHAEVEKLVLLAPAFGFHERWPKMMGEEKFRTWKETGEMELYHYGDKAPRKLGWQLAEDAAMWEATPEFTQPALIFHGENDMTVPVASSVAFAAAHANVKLQIFDAGHELTEVMDEMWTQTAAFLGIGK